MRFATLALALLLAGCTTAPRPVKSLQDFTFLLANPVGILALDANGQVLGPLVDLPKDSAPATPSLFPDGKSIVFSITLPPSAKTGFGSDIWTVGIDGSELKPLVEHEGDNVFYSSPLIDLTGAFVYYQRRAAVLKDGAYVGNDDSVERIDLKTRARTRIVQQAVDPTLSPDGKTIVYVKWTDGQPAGLWRVASDGSGNKPFFSVGDTWWWIQAPRFAPDGRSIIFSAAGHAAKSVAQHGLAHLGIPSELFLAPLEGTKVQSIAQTNDDVVPAWSPDGTHIAFVSGGALQLLNVGDGSVKPLNRGDNFFFGDLLWVRR